MGVPWRYPLVLLLVCVPMLVVVPAASADPVTWSCNNAGCSPNWYTTTVVVAFFVAPDPTIVGTRGCGVFSVNSDTAGQSFQCNVQYNTGGSYNTPAITVKRDATPPTVNMTFDRSPDSNGWYNHPVRVTFSGSDSVSGIASCTDTTYSGPDTPSTTINGSCRDNAGNSTGGTSPVFKYDSTPPKLSTIGFDWDDGTATLTWSASPDTTAIEIDRAPGASGPDPSAVFKGGLTGHFEDTGLKNKVKYVYTINAFDDAANKASESVTIVPGPKLYSPARGAFVGRRPLLAWRPFKGASYYNLQVYYGVGKAMRQLASVNVSGRKVLSAWPHRPRYRMKKTWTYKGKKRTLSRGHYRWYVYPGLGKRSANKYGPLIGASDFYVTKR